MLDVGDIISITEMFVLVSATNTRQVKTIAEEIELALKIDDGVGPRAVEGLGDATWVLMDFGDVIVHVFLAETREYYDLDRLWADAAVVEWQTDAEREPLSRRRRLSRGKGASARRARAGRLSARARRRSARAAVSRGSS